MLHIHLFSKLLQSLSSLPIQHLCSPIPTKSSHPLYCVSFIQHPPFLSPFLISFTLGLLTFTVCASFLLFPTLDPCNPLSPCDSFTSLVVSVLSSALLHFTCSKSFRHLFSVQHTFCHWFFHFSISFPMCISLTSGSCFSSISILSSFRITMLP